MAGISYMSIVTRGQAAMSTMPHSQASSSGSSSNSSPQIQNISRTGTDKAAAGTIGH